MSKRSDRIRRKKLRTAYLAQAIDKVMAMPRANEIKDTYYVSAGNIVCQALQFQAGILTLEDFENGVEGLLELVTEKDLDAVLDETPEDLFTLSSKKVFLFRGDNESVPSEVYLNGVCQRKVNNDRSQTKGYIDYAEQHVPGYEPSEETDLTKIGDRFFANQGNRLLAETTRRIYLVANYMAAELQRLMPENTVRNKSKGAVWIEGEITFDSDWPYKIWMMDLRTIDRIIQMHVEEYARLVEERASIAENEAMEFASDDNSVEAIQNRVNAQLTPSQKIIVKSVEYGKDMPYGYGTLSAWLVKFRRGLHANSHIIQQTLSNTFEGIEAELIKAAIKLEERRL